MGKTMQQLGGRGRTNQIEQWKATTWTIDLYQGEFVPMSKKRKAENVLVQSQVKKIALLKEELKRNEEALKVANIEIKKVQESNKRLSKKPVTMHNKSWSQYSAQYKRKQKKQVATDVCAALSFTKNTYYSPSRFELLNKETNELLIVKPNGSTVSQRQQPVQDNSDNIAKQTLFVKERYNISNTAYHELSMIHPAIPCMSMLNRLSKKMDAKSSLYPTPGLIEGVQQSFKERLKLRLTALVKKYPSIKDEEYIRVKLTGDGTRVSRNMHIIVIAFSVLHGDENPNSPTGNHPIAMLNAEEKYEQLSVSLKDIEDEIKSTQSVIIDGHMFHIEYFFGADMKYLAICLGLQAANADYSCIWCKCPTDERHITSKSWDTELRTIKEIQEFAPKKKTEEKYGCIRQPLFPSIPIDHVIPDILHMFLRISDVLINLLILELRRLDGLEKLQLRENQFNQTKAKNLDQYITFLNVTCKISFHMYVDKESKHLKWRDLTGPEKLKLFKHIEIPDLFPKLSNGQKVQQLWKNLQNIYETLWLPKNFNKAEIKEFAKTAKKWVRDFTDIYQSRHITPYMHVLWAHTPMFLEKFGSLAIFSQQGLEKLNDEITKAYFKSTNHRSKVALDQLMLKFNRLEALTDEQCYRTKQTHTCSNCKHTGHNSKTCTLHKQ